MNGVELLTADDRSTREARDPRAYVSLRQHDRIVQGLLLEAVDAIGQASGLTADAEARAALDAYADVLARLADVYDL